MKRLLAIAAGLAAAWALTGGGASLAAASSGTPYTDANAIASLALCGKDGQPVTSGSIDARPFVWAAVSAVGAPKPYDESGRTATLFAYQPRPDVEAGEWSGDLLTASARYTDVAHPMAAATRLDEPLSDFLDEYPTKLDGLVQLRLYLGAPGQPAYTLKYAAATIRVTGHTWQLVSSPSTASCRSGSAVSLESILPALSKAAPSSHSSPGSKAAASPRPTATPTTDARAATSAAPLHAQMSADDGHGHQDLAVLIAAVIAAVSVAWWWRMRRRPEDKS